MPLINIAADDVTEYHGDMTPAYADLYASMDFRTSDGVFVAKGSEQAPEFAQRFTASMNGSNIRIAAGTAHSSTDSLDHPEVLHTLVVYDAEGSKIKTVFTGLRIPPDAEDTTWAAIQIYSAGRAMTYPPTYLDSNQILALIAAQNGNAGGGAFEPVAASGAIELDATSRQHFLISPTGDADFTFTGGREGLHVRLLIRTVNTTGRTLSFGDGFIQTEDFETGTVADQWYVMDFVLVDDDGEIKALETSRSTQAYTSPGLGGGVEEPPPGDTTPPSVPTGLAGEYVSGADATAPTVPTGLAGEFAMDLTAPTVPTGLAGEAAGDTITATWLASTDSGTPTITASWSAATDSGGGGEPAIVASWNASTD
jgi:hypothetical protein